MSLDWPADAAVAAPSSIVKRDGRTVPFDDGRITLALTRCFSSLDRPADPPYMLDLTRRIVNIVAARMAATGETPTVEGVQDIAEMVLQAAGEFWAAKHYILYRAEHGRQRAERPIPADVVAAYEADAPYFPTPLQRFQFADKYSRFNYDLGRRETWVETVDRAVGFLHELAGDRLPSETYEWIRRGILEMKAMPSMRLLAMAGDAARRQNIALYNCSYQPVESIDSFVEGLIISMAGCGVGYSVESKYVEEFPRIKRRGSGAPDLYVVEDSSEGWASALRFGLERWFDGGDVIFDTSLIRPSGAPLRIKGGRASGPEPLQRMLDFMRRRILSRQGSFLRPIDAHDMMCAVGSAAVSGGVRRTAMISLFDYDDHEMLTCKDGDFERENSQRWNANNSVVWPDGGPDQLQFIGQFREMVKNGRGEPGIFRRDVAHRTMPERRSKAYEHGTNPCGEIILRPWEFCNLTSVVARREDTMKTIREKVALATAIGTIQSLAVHFPGLRPQYRQNCEDERLLGVDISGQMDSPIAQDSEVKSLLNDVAIRTNRQFAQALSINPSAAITCVKPSGNSSQLLDCSSGIHARWAPYYIRNVRVSASSPLARMLRDSGVPMSPENGDDPDNPRTWVVSFPVKAPDGSVTRNDRSAIEQCEFWLQNKMYWTEHNPSVTITYKPDEVIDVMAWLWDHREWVGGMAFLPSFDAKYDQLPYIEISQEEYEKRVAEFPEIDFAKVYRYESDDRTNASALPACDGPVCEVEP
jgi:ribonucleoside-diphosphate reductase alpha chain